MLIESGTIWKVKENMVVFFSNEFEGTIPMIAAGIPQIRLEPDNILLYLGQEKTNRKITIRNGTVFKFLFKNQMVYFNHNHEKGESFFVKNVLFKTILEKI